VLNICSNMERNKVLVLACTWDGFCCGKKIMQAGLVHVLSSFWKELVYGFGGSCLLLPAGAFYGENSCMCMVWCWNVFPS